jgi:gliding motility-associated-like protein
MSITKFFPLLFVLISYNAFNQIIPNPSLEGPPMDGFPPNGWFPCNLYSTPDTQPGTWNVSSNASHGNTFVSLVTRGNTGTVSSNYTEAIGVQLRGALKMNQNYHLRIDLALSPTFTSSYDDGKLIDFNNPVLLKIWGGTSSCYKDELLFTTAPIENTVWNTYEIDLSPKIRSYAYLILEAAFVSDVSYFGNVLIDNIVECPSMNLRMPADTVICEGDVLILDATIPDGNYLWSNNSKGPTVQITESGEYNVEVSNFCVSKNFQVKVTVASCECNLVTSNVFTPNGDGINDFFTFSPYPNVATFNLIIMNRWGRVVFESDDINKGWNGSIQGTSANSGVYFWKARIMCINNKKIVQKELKGTVSVLK